jgi:hypothetical protein
LHLLFDLRLPRVIYTVHYSVCCLNHRKTGERMV